VGTAGSITDPVGDAGGAGNPDIICANITVAGGNATFSVQFAPGTFSTSTTLVTFCLDTDRNPATGSPGIDSTGTVDAGVIGTDFIVVLGSAFYGTSSDILKYVGPPINTYSGVGATGVTFFDDGLQTVVPLSDIGGGSGLLNYKVISARQISTNGFTGILDVAPNVGLAPAVSVVNSTAPFGSFDTPVNNSAVSGAIAVTGWALSAVGISSVDIWREPNPGQGSALVYIDTADIVAGARPDVQQLYPTYPGNNQAGWGLEVLTNELPSNMGTTAVGNGTYNLHAIAHGTDGQSTDLGTKTIIVNNAAAVLPFGTIDTPTQGGTASGTAFVNFGWALTPVKTNIIPIDGSTIWVFIDGVRMGHPVYNNYRVDIATLFPGLQNSDGAVGYFYLDTTKLTNGVHTIAWSVTDSAGNDQGIGSRYFTVQN
jgi:hypothetical protein